MLARTQMTELILDLCPIANVRLLYKVFSDKVLAQIESGPECAQPEEQHGFRRRRRLAEYLLTANPVSEKKKRQQIHQIGM